MWVVLSFCGWSLVFDGQRSDDVNIHRGDRVPSDDVSLGGRVAGADDETESLANGQTDALPIARTEPHAHNVPDHEAHGVPATWLSHVGSLFEAPGAFKLQRRM